MQIWAKTQKNSQNKDSILYYIIYKGWDFLINCCLSNGKMMKYAFSLEKLFQASEVCKGGYLQSFLSTDSAFCTGMHFACLCNSHGYTFSMG
jgi:hypothetical protein